MFRKRKPQRSLFASSNLVPPTKAKRLQDSWAETFRARALPLIDEELFAPLYCADNGRPNRAVQTVFGVALLKEMFGLTDAEALEQLEFNLLWQHALELTPEEAHLPQKTLHNFRARLLRDDQGQLAFAATTDRIIATLGTKVSRQRLDSTHVISNIAVLTRLGLFCETMRVFLSALHAKHPELYETVPPGLLRRYVKEDGDPSAYDDARSAEGRRRLSVCARDLYRLGTQFEGTPAAQLEAYGLLPRLLEEQCVVVPCPQPAGDDEDDAGEGSVPVILKGSHHVSSASMQSPHDADVTYSGRKGKGYEVQVSETCHPDNGTEVNTHVAVTDACGSDAQATLPVLEALAARGLRPDELVADTAYGSADNAVAAERLGTELVSPVGGSAVAVDPAPPAERPLTGADFDVDPCGKEPATCPGGQSSSRHRLNAKNGNRLELTFERSTCEGCPLQARCPAKLNRKADAYAVTVDLLQANLTRRRRAEASGAFRERYAIRAGIEATNSELKRQHGLDDLHVRGRPRVVLAAHLKALACNVKRMVRALMPELRPVAPATA